MSPKTAPWPDSAGCRGHYFWDAIFSGPLDADVVTVESFDAGRELGERLASLGHQRVAYLGPQTDMSRKRLAGLRSGLELAGGVVPPECMRMIRNLGGRQMINRFVGEIMKAGKPGDSGPKGITALSVYNDYLAAAAILELRAMGVRVPEDISVTGFDAVRPDWYDGPELMTIGMPLEEIGAEAARTLYWRLAHPSAPPRRLSLVGKLVEGESVRQISAV